MKSYEREKLTKSVAKKLNKTKIRFVDISHDLAEQGENISSNYLWKMANYNKDGGIRRPSVERLLIVDKYLK
jgi:hypothetical protein